MSTLSQLTSGLLSPEGSSAFLRQSSFYYSSLGGGVLSPQNCLISGIIFPYMPVYAPHVAGIILAEYLPSEGLLYKQKCRVSKVLGVGDTLVTSSKTNTVPTSAVRLSVRGLISEAVADLSLPMRVMLVQLPGCRAENQGGYFRSLCFSKSNDRVCLQRGIDNAGQHVTDFQTPVKFERKQTSQ